MGLALGVKFDLELKRKTLKNTIYIVSDEQSATTWKKKGLFWTAARRGIVPLSSFAPVACDWPQSGRSSTEVAVRASESPPTDPHRGRALLPVRC